MDADRIDEIIRDLGCRNASGGIYTGSVYEFAYAIAAAARAEAIEACVAICDAYALDRWNLYKGRAPYTGREPERADPYTQGLSDGAEICSDRIGALLNTGDAARTDGNHPEVVALTQATAEWMERGEQYKAVERACMKAALRILRRNGHD